MRKQNFAEVKTNGDGGVRGDVNQDLFKAIVKMQIKEEKSRGLGGGGGIGRRGSRGWMWTKN